MHRLLFLILCLPIFCLAQFKVILKIKITDSALQKKIFFASSINNWNPNDEKYALTNTSLKNFELIIPNSPKSFKGKFTAGSWDKVETEKDGTSIKNRAFNIKSDTTIDLEIIAFQKDPALVVSTRSCQIIIISDSFYIPQLQTKRRIWMYVPKKYDGIKKFPVLYMHDGQNLFDKTTSFSNEWGVDEYLDDNNIDCIVIGIENGKETRIQEYNPYNNEKFGKEKGNMYLDFLVQTLKPFIDKSFVTLKGKENTFIAGSSMGGLISYYASIKYPDTFGKIGIFSPAFWINMNDLKKEITAKKSFTKQGFYFYCGTNESRDLVKETTDILNLTKVKCGACNIQLSIKKEGTHAEPNWQKELPNFLTWLLKK